MMLSGNSNFEHVWLAVEGDDMNRDIQLTNAILLDADSAIYHHRLNPKIVRQP